MNRADSETFSSLLNHGEFVQLLAVVEPRIAEVPQESFCRLLKGAALSGLGETSLAEDSFDKAQALATDALLQALRNLAVICHNSSRYQEALPWLERYRERLPNDWDVLAIHVKCLVMLENYDEALLELNKFLDVFPSHVDAIAACMSVLGVQGKFIEILVLAGRLGNPLLVKNVEFVKALTDALLELNLSPIADGFFGSSALCAEPTAADGQSVRTRFFFNKALSESKFDEAISLGAALLSENESEREIVLFNLALAYLAIGQLKDGWHLLRMRRQIWPGRLLKDIPAWNGENLSGKRVIVLSEQGLGDVIQFCRFLPMLRAHGVDVVFNGYPEVVKLLANDPSAEKLGLEQESLTKSSFDFQLQLLDLPAVVGCFEKADIPANTPYLFVNEKNRAYWQGRLRTENRLKVGLVWAGNPDYKNDHLRSASLSDFSSLAAIADISWFILQKGDAAVEEIPEGLRASSLSDEINSFDDTAAIIDCLDLVISVDTSVAHLAGALGRPVWILLPERGKDWRWFLGEETTPWYPSAKLMTRQGNVPWSEFIKQKVRPELVKWCRSQLGRSGIALSPLRDYEDYLLGERHAGMPSVHSWHCSLAEVGEVLPLARALMLETNQHQLISWLWESWSDDVRVLSARGESLALQGESSAALDLLWAAVRSGAQLPVSGYVVLGSLLHQTGKYLSALEECWSPALKDHPDSGVIAYHVGLCEQALGNRDLAAAYFEEALNYCPRLSVAQNCRGVLYKHDKKALALYQKTVLVDSNDETAWQHIIGYLGGQGAVHLAAMLGDWWSGIFRSEGFQLNYAGALLDSGRMEEARKVAFHLYHQYVLSVENRSQLAQLMYRLGETSVSSEIFSGCVQALNTESDKGKFALGWNLLARGDFVAGWPLYAKDCSHRKTNIPEWSGEPLSGKRLLVAQDQGMGDLFQFVSLVRCLPKDAVVTLAVNHSIVDFLKRQRLPAKVISESTVDWWQSGHKYDLHIAQMKLMSRLSINLLSPPLPCPYFYAKSGLVNFEIGSLKHKVGIVWAGNPNYGNDKFRSTRLEDWVPIFDVDSVDVYSFQKDVASNQAKAFDNLPITNIAKNCDSWEKTASALSEMDLVITVDSGVAHLSAGLGRPTWILLPAKGTDFRWQLDRADVPWYPSARLFRQKQGESWATVLLRVRDALDGFFK